MEITAETQSVFTMRSADDRQALAERLVELGLPAVHDLSMQRVTVLLHIQMFNISLKPQPYEKVLLRVFAQDVPCQIGLKGEREDGMAYIECYSADFYGEYSVERAAGRVKLLWDTRERIVTAFRAGHFDGGGALLDLMDGKVRVKVGRKR